MQFTRGFILATEGPLARRAVIFQWNPDAVHQSSGANWVAIPAAGRSVPYQQYTSGKKQMLQMRLKFSRSDNNDSFVRDMVMLLEALKEPVIEALGVLRPPVLHVRLGNDLIGDYVLDDVRARKHTSADAQTLLWRFADVELTLSKYV